VNTTHIYYCNFLNLDIDTTLVAARDKYTNHGWNGHVIYTNRGEEEEKERPDFIKEIQLSEACWQLEPIQASWHYCFYKDVLARILSLQSCYLYKISTHIHDLLCDESIIPTPSILMLRWFGSLCDSSHEWMETSTASSMISSLPWGLSSSYINRYAASFILAPLILSIHDSSLNNIFHLPNLWTAQPYDPNNSTQDQYVYEQKQHCYGINIQHINKKKRYIPKHINKAITYQLGYTTDVDENMMYHDDESTLPHTTAMISHMVGVHYLYNEMQIISILISNQHLTYDTTDASFPWMIWYYHDMYRIYRQQCMKIVDTTLSYLLLPELVEMVLLYVP